MLEYAIVGVIAFVAGIVIGRKISALQWSSLPWKVLKWHHESLGYRIIHPTSKVKKGDRALVAVEIDTHLIHSGEEIPIFEDDD